MFNNTYNNKRVLVTGHTGFKGSWLAFWLEKMGADVYGIALEPNTQPNHFELLGLNIKHYIQDIRSIRETQKIIKSINPEIIFHLAAQPLVRHSYYEPLETYQTNVLGTINILEIARNIPALKAVVVVSSDKCYENKELNDGYAESDAMGGPDPYSSSKGCVELVTAAYRRSFFNTENSTLIATARAGNVIGGGDWANERIFTDIVHAASCGETVSLRYPDAIRPWQHVLEPLSGYLSLASYLYNGNKEFASAWNFGPHSEKKYTVLDLVKEAKNNWKKIEFDIDNNDHPYETKNLILDISKASDIMKWQPVWSFRKTIHESTHWYKEFYENNNIITYNTLLQYIESAQKKGLSWSKI